MIRTASIAFLLTVLPSTVLAEPGGGTDLYRVNRQIEELMRDGRWQRLLEEAKASRQAVERSRQVAPPPTAFTTSRTPRR